MTRQKRNKVSNASHRDDDDGVQEILPWKEALWSIGVVAAVFLTFRHMRQSGSGSPVWRTTYPTETSIVSGTGTPNAVHGITYVRSNTYVGRSAALTTRSSVWPLERETVIDRLMGWREPRHSSHDRMADTIRQWIHLLFVRLPRSLRQWHLWSLIAAFGIRTLLRAGHVREGDWPTKDASHVLLQLRQSGSSGSERSQDNDDRSEMQPVHDVRVSLRRDPRRRRVQMRQMDSIADDLEKRHTASMQ